MPISGSIVQNAKTKLLIFSLCGAHLIAMFARTKVVKEFRKWVLDILEKETSQPCLLTVAKTTLLQLTSDSNLLSINQTPLKLLGCQSDKLPIIAYSDHKDRLTLEIAIANTHRSIYLKPVYKTCSSQGSANGKRPIEKLHDLDLNSDNL